MPVHPRGDGREAREVVAATLADGWLLLWFLLLPEAQLAVEERNDV